MTSWIKHRIGLSMALLIALSAATAVPAQVTFDFESDDQLEAFSAASGDLTDWSETTSQSLTGARSLRFDNAEPDPFRSFTYDLPIDMDAGTISVWFYDTVGQGSGTFQWGGSVILEDASNPADFVAVEINDLPYAGPPGLLPYHASEGVVDRGVQGDRYDSDSMAPRTVGWHEIVFTVGATTSTVAVDGLEADEVQGPGASVGDLRLRFMADSATAGGFGNWALGGEGYPARSGAVYYDDVTFSATAPTSATDRLDFEALDVSGLGSGSGNPEYDTVAEFMVSPAYNEPNMLGFVDTFETTTTQAHAGTNSVMFAGGEPLFKSIVIDLADASPGTITIPFYDALGQNEDFDQVGAAFIIEAGAAPSTFIAAEIWNAPYPFTAADKTYYFTARPIPFASGFFSDYFGARSVGWQTLEIELTETYSRMTINGVGADGANNGAVYDGPGLDANPRLRIMADSPTLGGFLNWKDNSGWSDPESPELDALYFEKATPYLFLDDLSLPIFNLNSANHWMVYE